MKSLFVVLLICSVLFLSACHLKDYKSNKTVLEITEIAEEQQIPKAILQQLDEELKEEFKTTPPLYSFMPINVAFLQKQEEVLKQPHIQYNLPKGGGEIDMRDVVSGEGSFYMYFPEEQFKNTEMELLHLFFVSNSPQTKINNEQFGLGCGKWNDLKSKFKNLQRSEYLKLNTNDLRYLKVIAGTYVFVFKQARNLYLTQLTITNSRYTESLCTQVVTNES
jgi:hypothetical protein